MRQSQSSTLASVTWVVTPCPGWLTVFPWSRTCASTFRTGPRDTFDRADLTGGYCTEDGIAQVQGKGDAQESVEGSWFSGLEAPQGAQTDPGIFCQHGLCHIAGQSQFRQTGSDLGLYLSGCFHVSH